MSDDKPPMFTEDQLNELTGVLRMAIPGVKVGGKVSIWYSSALFLHGTHWRKIREAAKVLQEYLGDEYVVTSNAGAVWIALRKHITGAT